MKNKRTVIIVSFVIALVVAVIVFLGIKFSGVLSLVFDWDNVTSLVNSQRYSREEIENKMQDNKEKMEKIAKENPHINVRGDLTAEESKAFAEGKISKEEAVAIVKGDKTLEEVLTEKESTKQTKQDTSGEDSKDTPSKPLTENPEKQESTGKTEQNKPASQEKPSKSDNPSPAKKPSAESPKKDKDNSAKEEKPATKPSEPSSDTSSKPSAEKSEPPAPVDRPSEIIAELYVAQADFINRLEAIGDRAYEDYKDIHYKRESIPAIVESYSAEVSALERECDARVKALLAELEAELKKVNGDLSVVKEIQTFYYKEKSLKKTYYLNRLNDEDYK